jgi:hypothetical protein
MSEKNEVTAQSAITALVGLAEKAKTPDEALKFSQAACNSANAFRVLLDIQVNSKDQGMNG